MAFRNYHYMLIRAPYSDCSACKHILRLDSSPKCVKKFTKDNRNHALFEGKHTCVLAAVRFFLFTGLEWVNLLNPRFLSTCTLYIPFSTERFLTFGNW